MSFKNEIINAYHHLIHTLIENIRDIPSVEFYSEPIPIQLNPSLTKIVPPHNEEEGEVMKDIIGKYHTLTKYLLSFGNFVQAKKKINTRIKCEEISTKDLFQPFLLNAAIIIPANNEKSVIQNYLEQHDTRFIGINHISPALRAFLNSTCFGTCIMESADIMQLRSFKLDIDLRVFVEKGGMLMGFGPNFVELCRDLFYSSWDFKNSTNECDVANIQLSNTVSPYSKCCHNILRKTDFPDYICLQTSCISNVTDIECLYKTYGAPNLTMDDVELLFSQLTMSSSTAGIAIGHYGYGSFVYLGDIPAAANTTVAEILFKLIQRTAFNHHPLLHELPIVSTASNDIVGMRDIVDNGDNNGDNNGDTDEEEDLPLLAVLSYYASKWEKNESKSSSQIPNARLSTVSSSQWKCSCGFINSNLKSLCMNCFSVCPEILNRITMDSGTVLLTTVVLTSMPEMKGRPRWQCTHCNLDNDAHFVVCSVCYTCKFAEIMRSKSSETASYRPVIRPPTRMELLEKWKVDVAEHLRGKMYPIAVSIVESLVPKPIALANELAARNETVSIYDLLFNDSKSRFIIEGSGLNAKVKLTDSLYCDSNNDAQRLSSYRDQIYNFLKSKQRSVPVVEVSQQVRRPLGMGDELRLTNDILQPDARFQLSVDKKWVEAVDVRKEPAERKRPLVAVEDGEEHEPGGPRIFSWEENKAWKKKLKQRPLADKILAASEAPLDHTQCAKDLRQFIVDSGKPFITNKTTDSIRSFYIKYPPYADVIKQFGGLKSFCKHKDHKRFLNWKDPVSKTEQLCKIYPGLGCT